MPERGQDKCKAREGSGAKARGGLGQIQSLHRLKAGLELGKTSIRSQQGQCQGRTGIHRAKADQGRVEPGQNHSREGSNPWNGQCVASTMS